MDFALPHVHEKSLATLSNIRHIITATNQTKSGEEVAIEDMLVQAANEAAASLVLGNTNSETGDYNPELVDTAAYPERMTPQSETIRVGSLVVIFESFDNLKFCYAKKGAIFSNRNG